jgi:hypothetical protein
MVSALYTSVPQMTAATYRQSIETYINARNLQSHEIASLITTAGKQNNAGRRNLAFLSRQRVILLNTAF